MIPTLSRPGSLTPGEPDLWTPPPLPVARPGPRKELEAGLSLRQQEGETPQAGVHGPGQVPVAGVSLARSLQRRTLTEVPFPRSSSAAVSSHGSARPRLWSAARAVSGNTNWGPPVRAPHLPLPVSGAWRGQGSLLSAGAAAEGPRGKSRLCFQDPAGQGSGLRPNGWAPRGRPAPLATPRTGDDGGQ